MRFDSALRQKAITSGAKAHVDYIAFTPGINPRPTLKPTFSAACKTLIYQSRPIKANPICPRFHPQRNGFVSFQSSTRVADRQGHENAVLSGAA
jgi:hypothetical protein